METIEIKQETKIHMPANVFSTLPAKLKRKDDIVDFVTNGVVNIGDEVYQLMPKSHKFIIDEIIEQRPARGNWTGKSHEGTNPIWSKCRCRLVILNQNGVPIQ